MKISKIEVQKKNKKRSSIFINGEFKFGLSNDLVIKYDLKEGDEITESKIKDILLAEEKERLKMEAYRLLGYRSRSTKELNERLLKLGYETEIVQAIINELIDEGILDDQKFVREFISDYTELKPKGNIFLRHELRKKGIAPELIVETIKQRDEREIIKKLLKTKFCKFNIKDPKDRAKLIRRFLGRGFTPNLVYEVLGEEQ